MDLISRIDRARIADSHRSLALVVAFSSVFLVACTLNPFAPTPAPAAVEDAFAPSAEAVHGERVDWWTAFEDPVLDRVVEAALDSNFDLEEAVARVRQAKARARVARAVRLPAMQVLAAANDFDMPTNAGLGAQMEALGLGSDVFGAFGFVLPERIDLSTYSAGPEFAYEIDLWGRQRDAARAAGAETLAAESDLDAARIRVLAETVGTYLEVVDLRRQRALAAEMVDILKDWKSLTAARYAGGLTDARGLYALRRELHASEAELPKLEGLLANAEGRLWVLVGGYREDLADQLPDALTPSASRVAVPEGIPADLLVQRPDVRAAQQRAEAARYALGAQRAALLPLLSIAGSVGLQSAEAGAWFDPDQWFHNLSVNLLAPVLQPGRLRGNVAVAQAKLDEAVAAFGRAVATAAVEVQSALAGLETSRRRLALLSAQEDQARAEAALQEERYVSGVEDYAGYLAASRMLVGAMSARAAGERDLGYARLALHRALGGTWTARESGALARGSATSVAGRGGASAYTD